MDEETLDRMRATAQANLGREVPDLNNFFLLDVPRGSDPAEWMDALNRLAEVELAFPKPLPAPSPVEAALASCLLPGDLTQHQGYLLPATDGIDAQFLRTLGHAGQNVHLVDLEYGWNREHLDLPAVTLIVPPRQRPLFEFPDHGTAVLGVLTSLDNGFGTTGGATGASFGIAPAITSPAFSEVVVFQHAVAGLAAGDVVLIELQFTGPNVSGTHDGYVPVEWDFAMYASILVAVGNGIHVVEAAGNGPGENLDDPVYDAGHAPFRRENDSGAILVGAGGVPAAFGGVTPDRSRFGFSNFGSRLDLQGWGALVATAGYGDVYDDEGVNLYYTLRFSGTSSASAIVAVAATLLEDFHEARFGTALTPAELRSVLVETGSPQLDGFRPASERIGPRPDLRAAACRFDSASPRIDCPAEVTVEAASPAGVPASDPVLAAFLDGVSVSDDVDPHPTVTSDAPTSFPLGTTAVTFTATDACGNRATCQGTVSIVDRTPPALALALGRTTLWPPNHRLAPIDVRASVSDAVDPSPILVLESITCDEPDQSAEKGDEPCDVQDAALGTHDLRVLLRSERLGRGDGRTYTLTYSARDRSGNETETRVTVTVPHDRGGG
jgi:hypothetical protein